jgi:EAL domain-containing protein (putative c-di-GMP-specific phosphodiesterase class I)
MGEIGTWSLREACRQAVAWDAQGLRLRVSVNATARQLLQADFADMAHRCLAEGGLSGERLAVEVPERAIATREPQLARTLEDLRSMGVTVAVDDFGGGAA